MRRIVVYSGNRRYYNNMLAASKSLLSHTQVDHVYFLTEDDAFPSPLPPVISCINVSQQTIFPLDGPNINNHYSYMTTVRAALTRILPTDVRRVLWLDSDTIVTDDISEIFDYDISDCFFAAVEDVYTGGLVTNPYYNAGVMLMNLDLFRSTQQDDLIIRTINAKHYRHLEQDILNILCKDKILPLPSEYNFSFISRPCSHPKIRHYLDRAKRDLPSAQAPYISLDWDDIRYAKSKGEELC